MLEPKDLRLPHSAWREGQWELLSRLAGVESKFVLLQAPTGTGKSLVAVALAKVLGYERVLILVGTKNYRISTVGNSPLLRTPGDATTSPV